jgi:diadenosine tetraphosphate (Ap4A) HIT family hydrolase
MLDFELHPRLAADTYHIGELDFCRLLLMNDSRFPWCILVPRQTGLRELHQIPLQNQTELLSDINRVSLALASRHHVAKLNIGALGNLVPQLHIHVIGRHQQDAAWPAPVWGHGQATPYEEEEASRLIEALRDACGIRSAR